MNVHFTASNYQLEKHIDDYRSIVDAVKKQGHTMTREWLEEDLGRRTTKSSYSPTEYKEIWQKVKMSILSADVVIVDGSINSFSIGYQTAFALSNKKPVLVMTSDHEISQTIIAGEDNPLLFIKNYTTKNLESVVNEFLNKFNIAKQDMRFNMFIDRETQAFLEIESYKTGKTKAKIIRDMIKKEIQNKNGL
ncbi:hypothetical protein H7200_02725 [Candidatus Saccharibacteria bacterium]|nr:hypothetical protein [Candidatus Saccharibacteria bacterium]